MCRIILLSILMFQSASLFAADSPVISWLISSDRRIRGNSELVRLVDGKIEQKIPIGRSVGYQYSTSRILVSGYLNNKQILRTWNIRTGKEMTSCEMADVSFPGSVLKDSSPSPINGRVIDGHEQFMFSGWEYKSFLPFLKPRYQNSNLFSRIQYHVVDLNSGKGIAKEISDYAMLEEQKSSSWPTTILGRPGFKLSKDLFLEYLPAKGIFERKQIPETEPEWNYYEDIGLVKYRENKLTLLSNVQLKPLLKRKEYPLPKYPHSRTSIWIFNGKTMVIPVLIEKTGEDKKEKKEKVARISTKIILFDLFNQEEIYQKEFPFKVQTVRLSKNLEEFYMTNHQKKIAYHYNRASEKLLKIDYTWSPHTCFIPCFPESTQ